MASSLAAQLAQSTSLNAALLNPNRRRPTESYLFPAKEAAQHDLDAIYAIGNNGFSQLMSLDPSLRQFERSLFSDAAKNTDRTLLNADANEELNKQIASLLPLLGPFLLDAPTGRVIEWLVRRFRINEFNVQDVLTLFLPYHETPHFEKMLSILHIDDKSAFRFLQAYKTTAKPLRRSGLVSEMTKNSDLARFVSQLLPNTVKNGGAGIHRALLVFHTGVLLDFIATSKELNEGTTTFLLAASLDILQEEPSEVQKANASLLQEAVLASLLVLAGLSQKCHFTKKAIKTILPAVAARASNISTKQLVRTLVCLCGPQDELEKLPRTILSALVKKPDVDAELREAATYVGSEKMLSPLVAALIAKLDKERHLSVLTSLLSYSALPEAVARKAASLLLSSIVASGDPAATESVNARKALSVLQLHHARIVEQVCTEAMSNEGEKEAIEQIILSLSMSKSEKETDMIIASFNADANTRALAVKDLISTLSRPSATLSDKDAAADALRGRLLDTSPAVIEALYAQPAAVLPVLLDDAPAYLEALSSAPLSRALARLHLAFLATHVYPHLRVRDAALAERVVFDVFWPYLALSKPRQKTAAVVWEILEGAEGEGGVARYELLGGCVDAVRWEQSAGRAGEKAKEDEQKATERMAKVNLALAAKMADNILASNNYSHLFERLMEKLKDENTHARVLAYLTARALLSRLSGEHLIDAAYAILRTSGLGSLDGMGDFMRGVNDLGVFLNDMSVATAIVLKPNSQTTLHRLQVSVLAMMPVIPRPPGVTLDWVIASTETPFDQNSNDTRGVRYIQLLRAVYALSNSSARLPVLSVNLLRALFVNLGDEALSFLVGIWLSPPRAGKGADGDHLRIAALLHATAFLEAHHATEHWLDFQTILPALLVALQNSDRRVREAAVSCVHTLVRLVEKAPSAIYAYDAVYGPTSSLLQYAEWADFSKYVSALGAVMEHVTHDPAYLREFHREHLSAAKGDGKKVASYKQRILFYLMSHVNSCPILSVKTSLLQSLETTVNESKHQALAPTLQHLSTVVTPTTEAVDRDTESFFVLATATIDSTAVSELNDVKKPTWSLFEGFLRTCLLNRHLKLAREAIVRNAQQLLRGRLSAERREQLCKFLVDIAGQPDASVSDCKMLLDDILNDVAITIRLLSIYQPDAVDAAEPAQKRARVDQVAQNSKSHALTLFIEVLSAKSLPGSLELITSLLEALTRVAHDTHAVSADRTYNEQLLMNALENCVNSMPENVSAQAGAIRADILIELIRAADNPQTFHQALLLIAAMARLAPDAILHNVMPVFTFMGSNVFHRDDTYSFRVVQKTIDSIVPVMVTSLRSNNALGLDLYMASRDFLRIFTDAANHIPRHRRTKFYAHLVDVLGPDEFLAPICMLLVEKLSKRLVRQQKNEVETSLSLPVALFQNYGAKRKMGLLIETAREAERLVKRATDGGEETCLLAYPTDEEDKLRATSLQRAHALLIYCAHSLNDLANDSPRKLKSYDNNTPSELLAVLLRVSVLADAHEDGSEIAQVAREGLAGTLKTMTAAEFVGGVLTMLQSANIQVQYGVLIVLRDCVGDIAEPTRKGLVESMKQVIDCMKAILSNGQDAQENRLTVVTLQAAESVIRTADSGELNTLTTLVPLVLTRVREEPTSSAALAVLVSMSSRLGPRIIPHLKRIVQACTQVLVSYNTSPHGDNPASGALDVLQALLTSVPTFWGESEIMQLVQTYIQDCTDASHAESNYMTPLMKTVAKRLPSKTLLPTLSKYWSTATELSGPQFVTSKFAGYFVLLKRVLRVAERPVVLECIRPLFNNYQSAFDLISEENRSEIEPSIISSFIELVVKLNETAFKPLIRKLSDWAFTGQGAGPMRGVTFCHVYAALLGYFKALMVPYMSFIWSSILKLLDEYAVGTASHAGLWASALVVITQTLTCDEGGFWREDKTRQLVPALAKQIPTCVQLHPPEGRTALVDCLVATMEAVHDDALLKKMNMDILMHTRSEEASVRLLSLTCSTALWRAHGGKLLGVVAETATFITECAEDDNDSVVQEAHHLKDAVEGVAGKIDV